MRGLHLAVTALLSLLVFSAAANAASVREGPPVVGQVSEYELGAGTRPQALVSGPDGNLWFTEGGRPKVGRITTSGQITEFDLPAGAGSATAIAAGPDGNLWFTESGAARIGRITTQGTVTEFPLAGTREFWGGDIAAGPDGGLWTTLPGAGAIARIGTDGTVTGFPLPEEAPAGYPNDIVLGPDRALWFGKSQAGTLGRITTSGEITQLALPEGQTISALTSGPFDNLWYAIGGGRIGWVIPGVAQGTTACINQCSSPVTDLTEGPDGKLWFVAGVGGTSFYNAPGTIGTYAPPPLEVRVVGNADLRNRTVYVPLSCRWTPAGRNCKGNLRLSGGGQVLRKRLSLRLGGKQRVAVRMPPQLASRLAQRGRVVLKATTTVVGGSRDTSRIVLRRP